MVDLDQHKTSTLWFNSTPDENGIYRLALEFGADEAMPLSDEEAAAWARAVLMAAAIATHEEHLARELVRTAMPQESIALLVGTVRERRGGQASAPGPFGLELVPQLGQRDLSGFLILRRNGEDLGYWSIQDAIDHAQGIFMAVVTLGLDTTLYQTLRSEFGLPHETAAGLIAAMGTTPTDDSQEADPPSDGESD